MNKNETQAIDEETAKAEASLIINEAMEWETFPHFLIGWMMSNHHKEMAEAAESWIEVNGYEPEEN